MRVPSFVISPWVRAGTVFGHDAFPASPAAPGTTAPEAPAPSVAGRPENLYFDHTSILKTIARRFLSTAPPYMGARYAAASDLSAVLTDVLRQPQFLPFIRYNMQYAASQLMMDVQGANPAAGTPLWQYPANGTVAQDFSFEDAGDGLVYIRSHVSNLYLTVNDLTSPPGVIQDIKYTGLGPNNAIAGARRQELQKWRLTSTGISIPGRDLFLIESEAFPGQALQPAAPGQAQSLLVLGDAGNIIGIRPQTRAWKVTSPLLSDPLTNAPG